MTENSEARKRREERTAPHVPTPARGSSSDGTHCAVCRRGIWRKGLDEWAHVEVMAWVTNQPKEQA